MHVDPECLKAADPVELPDLALRSPSLRVNPHQTVERAPTAGGKIAIYGYWGQYRLDNVRNRL